MESKLLRLLNISLHSKLSHKERLLPEQQLEKSEELSTEKVRLEKLRSILTSQKFSFEPYFAVKVMNKINNLKTEIDLSQGMMFAFKRVAIPMLAAAVVLMLFSIFRGGSFAFDNFMGLDSLQPQYLSEFLLFNY
jgi:hypothetical protein